MRLLLCAAIAALAIIACGGGTPSPSAPAGAAGGTIGGPCGSDSECPASYTCDKDDQGGECNKKCQTSADCGPGGTCTPEKECLASCQTSADCKRAGYACMGKAPVTYCDIPEAAERGAN